MDIYKFGQCVVRNYIFILILVIIIKCLATEVQCSPMKPYQLVENWRKPHSTFRWCM